MQKLFDKGYADALAEDASFDPYMSDSNDPYWLGYAKGRDENVLQVSAENDKQEMFNTGYKDGLTAHEVTPTPPEGATDVYYLGLQEGIAARDFISKSRVDQTKQPEDVVNSPSHYKLNGLDVEWIDVRSALLRAIPKGIPYEAVTSWSEAITYLARMWGKNGLEDLKKAQVYIRTSNQNHGGKLMQPEIFKPTVKLKWITPDTDQMIVDIARVSVLDSEGKSPRSLIAYLINHKHWSPFEMANMCVEVYAPRDITRQILRHGMRPQEYSQRYAEVTEELFCGRETRMQHPTNRQMSLKCQSESLSTMFSVPNKMY